MCQCHVGVRRDTCQTLGHSLVGECAWFIDLVYMRHIKAKNIIL